MHTYSSRDRGGRIRGGCGATGAPGASPAAGGSRGVGPRPNSPQCCAADARQAPVHILLFQIMTPIYVFNNCALGLGIV